MSGAIKTRPKFCYVTLSFVLVTLSGWHPTAVLTAAAGDQGVGFSAPRQALPLPSRTQLEASSYNGQACEWCNQAPSFPNTRIPAQDLVGCNSSYCASDISNVPCMDDPDTGCLCATSNSCGVLPVSAALQLGRILLMQGSHFFNVNPTTNTTYVSHFNLLPHQLLWYVYNLTISDDTFPFYPTLFDQLPEGFGCPDWPVVQASLTSTEEQKSLSEVLWSRYDWNENQPEEAMLPNVSCWVDAPVAANLLTGAILQLYRPCQDMAPTEACRNITVFWQAPKSPCTETDAEARAVQCANITYHFKAPDKIPCDEESIQLFNTTGQAVAVTSSDQQ